MAEKSSKKSLPMMWGDQAVRAKRTCRKSALERAACADEQASEDENVAENFLPADLAEAVKAAIQQLGERIHSSLDTKLESVVDKVSQVVSTVGETAARVDNLVERVEELEMSLAATRQRVEVLERGHKKVAERQDDCENRDRRNNLRLIGVPERVEGSDAVTFFSTWLPTVFQVEFKGGKVKLDRAHRALAPAPKNREKPRAVIIRVHNFQDKCRLMEACRRLKEVSYAGQRVFMYQDFSAEVQRRRMEFAAVKRELRNLGHTYALLYPARLRVNYADKTEICESVQAARALLQRIQQVGAEAEASVS